MPGIVTDQGVVHYEVYGQGKPVILLHGWLGSWRLWQSTMEGLGRGHRVYALDFWGFGESGKRRDSYNINDFVERRYRKYEQRKYPLTYGMVHRGEENRKTELVISNF